MNPAESEATTKQVQAGFERMAGHTVAICGLARDCKKSLENLAPSLQQLGECFNNYQVIIVENDSTDGSAQFLRNWSGTDSHVRLIQFSVCPWVKRAEQEARKTQWWFSKARMERMNFARNLYLEAACNTGLPDFVIVVDLDILSFSLSGIAHTFGLQTAWDFMASNGTRYSIRHPFRRKVYWDTYVYEPHGGFEGGILRKRDIVAEQKRLVKKLNGSVPLPVKSAFGGLCIYPALALKSHHYSVIPNNDPEVEVLCDHTTLHRSMATSGWDKGFINPYQEVRYETPMNTFKRYLKRS